MAGEDAAFSAGAAALQNPPKKEEEDDEDEEDNLPLSVSRGRKKASDANASKVKKEEGNEKQKSTGNSKAKASKLKKEEPDSDDDIKPKLEKRNAAVSNPKTPKIKKIKDEDFEDDTKEEKKTKKVKKPAGDEKVKKEKKVYALPGQRHDPPPERDPLRIFYESLYEQVPTSEMAAIWLMEWGLLPLDVAREIWVKKQGQKLKSPVKTVSTKRNTPLLSAEKTNSASRDAGKTTAQKKRRASSDTDDDEDDFVIPKTKTKRQKISS